MINKTQVRFGLIGAGAIAQTYVKSFGDCRNAELVAVADVRKEAADAIAGDVGCDALDSHEKMLDEAKLDAVVICTPPATHEPIALACFHRELHVLCEKPLAMSGESARRILSAAQASGVRFTMASKFRYVQDVIKAKSLVESGILGDIILFENTFVADELWGLLAFTMEPTRSTSFATSLGLSPKCRQWKANAFKTWMSKILAACSSAANKASWLASTFRGA